MSIYYASFEQFGKVQNFLDELLRGGVSPDDLSVITCRVPEGLESSNEGTVGDATAFVGRDDDPIVDEILHPQGKDITDLTAAHESEVRGGISTSDRSRNVDSVDQSDDSQRLAENMMLEPPRHTPQSQHEHDDLALTLRTGFPTPVPTLDDVQDTETPMQDQMTGGIETIVVRDAGLIMGGGGLATAAFDVINPKHTHDSMALVAYLKDEGVQEEAAGDIRDAFDAGDIVVAVELVPGRVREDFIESVAERCGGRSFGMFDAPRFYDEGGEGRASAL
jgi:hypothetical protein